MVSCHGYMPNFNGKPKLEILGGGGEGDSREGNDRSILSISEINAGNNVDSKVLVRVSLKGIWKKVCVNVAVGVNYR